VVKLNPNIKNKSQYNHQIIINSIKLRERLSVNLKFLNESYWSVSGDGEWRKRGLEDKKTRKNLQ
jgi:hypothetical protein